MSLRLFLVVVGLCPRACAEPKFSAATELRFVHIGKCGGTTVHQWLEEACTQNQSFASTCSFYHMRRDYILGGNAANFVVWVRAGCARPDSAVSVGL